MNRQEALSLGRGNASSCLISDIAAHAAAAFSVPALSVDRRTEFSDCLAIFGGAMELQRPATVVAAEKGDSTFVKVCRRVWAGALGLSCPAITGSGRRRLCLSADVSATRSPGRFDVPPLAEFCEFTNIMMSLVSGTRLGSDLIGSRRPLESKTSGVSGTSSAHNEIRVPRYRASDRQT
jgi:hypothetical protein